MTTSVFNLYNSLILLALLLAILCALLCSEIELELVVETEDSPMVMTCCGLNRNVPRKIMWLNNCPQMMTTLGKVVELLECRALLEEAGCSSLNLEVL